MRNKIIIELPEEVLKTLGKSAIDAEKNVKTLLSLF